MVVVVEFLLVMAAGSVLDGTPAPAAPVDELETKAWPVFLVRDWGEGSMVVVGSRVGGDGGDLVLPRMLPFLAPPPPPPPSPPPPTLGDRREEVGDRVGLEKADPPLMREEL